MSVKEREEVFDLDFTYGDEVVHIFDHRTQRTMCGGPRSWDHRGHFDPNREIRTKCSCGTPVCPVCVHLGRERHEECGG